MKLNQNGFSMVEMMITVAVIGILSSMAGPSYAIMIARSRQAEAKAAVSEVYFKEQGYFSEFSHYTACLWEIGYEPAPGAPRYYGSGFSGANPDPVVTRLTSGASCDTTGGTAWGGWARNSQTFNANVWANNALTHTQPTAPFVATATAFTAVAFGSVASYSPIMDMWTITQEKVLRNVQPGL